ncbi:MAG: tRNA uridine-5-carboxymethylaminomethyl(34) synthesis GTPase MnmE [Bacteroidota bacterium]
MENSPLNTDTIAAVATAHGTGAVAMIRISGKDSFTICDKIFRLKKTKNFSASKCKTQTIHFGEIFFEDVVLDDVLISIFKSPHSYTGEDVIEISCHGSPYIQQQILQLLIRHNARFANAGEFTLRAFLNGKFDLSQAEAVADIVSANSSASHRAAMLQMRDGFSNKIKLLRNNLINFSSLIELELDFSEEDVEFASRYDLRQLILSIQQVVQELIQSFEMGNVIKNGVPVCIAGRTNAGKSTLMNALLEEERAIVSEIPGTTRDVIEDEIVIDGVQFRFMDTAGIQETTDKIESIGILKTFEKIREAFIVIYLFDIHNTSISELKNEIEILKQNINNGTIIIVGNKIDKGNIIYIKKEFESFNNILFISAKEKNNLNELKKCLIHIFDSKVSDIPGHIITNIRHFEVLCNTRNALANIIQGIDNKISGELIANDIRNALYHLGLITGEITTDDILKNIFEKFCIGK